MPGTPKKPCRKCKKKLTTETYCGSCLPIIQARQKQNNQRYDTNRGNATFRGYGTDWQKTRAIKINQNPICECDRCQEMQRVKVSTVVHHIKPVNTHQKLRLKYNNLISMSWRCHEVEEGRLRDREYEQWKRDIRDIITSEEHPPNADMVTTGTR